MPNISSQLIAARLFQGFCNDPSFRAAAFSGGAYDILLESKPWDGSNIYPNEQACALAAKWLRSFADSLEGLIK